MQPGVEVACSPSHRPLLRVEITPVKPVLTCFQAPGIANFCSDPVLGQDEVWQRAGWLARAEPTLEFALMTALVDPTTGGELAGERVCLSRAIVGAGGELRHGRRAVGRRGSEAVRGGRAGQDSSSSAIETTSYVDLARSFPVTCKAPAADSPGGDAGVQCAPAGSADR
jgi:hypothetical protein